MVLHRRHWLVHVTGIGAVVFYRRAGLRLMWPWCRYFWREVPVKIIWLWRGAHYEG